MRKLISTFLLSLMLFTVIKAQTIFDPATFTGTLPAGMDTVRIDGKKYLRVVLNGWESNLNIPAFTIGAEKGVACKFKFAKSATDTITVMTQINATVQLKDTINRIPNPWGEGTIPSDVGLTQNPPSVGSFLRAMGTFSSEMLVVHQLQFSAQEKYSWGPLTGDTLWVGEIYTVDPQVLFDPATFDGTLPAGMEIVDEGGTKLLKVTTNEWNSVLDIDPFNMGDNNFWSFQAKLDAGTSGTTIDTINTFVGANFSGGSFNLGAASSATLKTYEGDAKNDVTVTQLQFAAQKSAGSWPALTGAIIYVGKITVSFIQPEAAPAKNTFTVPYIPLTDFVDADGVIQPDEYWKNVTVANVDRQALPANLTPVITDSKGTMKLAWTEDYLYVLIEAEDATPINLPAGSETYWENDGAEIFMDMKNRRFVGQKRIEGEQHQIRFNLGRTDADTSHIMYAGVKEKVIWGMMLSSNGWRLEAQIPWANMCNGSVAAEDIDAFVTDSIKAGKKVGWEVSIINANAANTRNSIMNWANDQQADKAYTTNEFYGELTLTGGPSAIKTKTVNQLKIYPNPVNDMIFIASDNINSFKIIDISGKVVIEGKYLKNGINVSNLQNGIYFITAVDYDNNVTVNKFVKR